MYRKSKFLVRADLNAIHQSQVEALGDPGTWFSGQQRLAIVEEARSALAGGSTSGRDVVLLLAHQLAASPQGFTETVYTGALDAGLSDAEYVEIVGLVSRLVNFDVLARGLGMDPVQLPAPKAGEPTRERPIEAVLEGAWAPTIPNGKQGGELGRGLYGGRWKPFIIRALSLVPAELRKHYELEEVQYLPLDRFPEYEYRHHEGLSRPQVEVVAGRVSALNECFY